MGILDLKNMIAIWVTHNRMEDIESILYSFSDGFNHVNEAREADMSAVQKGSRGPERTSRSRNAQKMTEHSDNIGE